MRVLRGSVLTRISALECLVPQEYAVGSAAIWPLYSPGVLYQVNGEAVCKGRGVTHAWLTHSQGCKERAGPHIVHVAGNQRAGEQSMSCREAPGPHSGAAAGKLRAHAYQASPSIYAQVVR